MSNELAIIRHHNEIVLSYCNGSNTVADITRLAGLNVVQVIVVLRRLANLGDIVA